MRRFVAPFRVIAHLHDEQPPIFIERHRDRINHQRLGGDQFEPKAFFDLERGHRLVRLRWRNARKIFAGNLRLGGGNAKRN